MTSTALTLNDKSMIKGRTFLFLLGLSMSIYGCSGSSSNTGGSGGTVSVSFSWNLPVEREDGSTSLPSSEIAGFFITYGSAPGNTDGSFYVEGAVTSSTAQLPSGTWYYRVYTVDTNGLVGNPTEEATVTL